MIGQATSPIVAAVNALQSDVNGIKCKLPETVTLPYSCATAIPTGTTTTLPIVFTSGGGNP